MKEESENFGLKLDIQKTKIMASSPITSWQVDGETVETVADYFSGLHEIKSNQIKSNPTLFPHFPHLFAMN